MYPIHKKLTICTRMLIHRQTERLEVPNRGSTKAREQRGDGSTEQKKR